MCVLSPFLIHFPLKRDDPFPPHPRARYRPLTYISPPPQHRPPFFGAVRNPFFLPATSDGISLSRFSPSSHWSWLLSRRGRTTSGIFASRNCSAGIFFREHEFVPRENSAALPLSIDVLAEQGRSIGHSDFTAASDRKRHATTA